MEQTLINWAMGGFGALVGFTLNTLWQTVKELQLADKALSAKVSEIAVLVAGDYVRRDEFSRTLERLFTKLETIETKINDKMDR